MTEFEELFKENREFIFKYLMKLSHDASLAEELTQETFVKALKAIDQFDGNSRLETWLCQIARNAWMDECRRRKRLSPLPEREPAAPDSDPAARMETSEGAMEILRAAHLLDETAKEVFLLRTCGERDFASIGELFGKSASWARVTYHRAKVKVLETIKEKEGTI